mgnify:CR=1 FL=1
MYRSALRSAASGAEQRDAAVLREDRSEAADS